MLKGCFRQTRAQSSEHYVCCMPLRFIAGVFLPASFIAFGQQRVLWTFPARFVGTFALARHHAVRARRPDEGVPTVAEAEPLAQAAATHVYVAVRIFWPTCERFAAPRDPKPLAWEVAPVGGDARMRPPQAVSR